MGLDWHRPTRRGSKAMNLKQIIQHECACYFRTGPYGVKDWCELRGHRCIAFGEFKRCKRFETTVLPSQPDASAEYAELVRLDSEPTLLGVERTPPKAQRAPTAPREQLTL